MERSENGKKTNFRLALPFRRDSYLRKFLMNLRGILVSPDGGKVGALSELGSDAMDTLFHVIALEVLKAPLCGIAPEEKQPA